MSAPLEPYTETFRVRSYEAGVDGLATPASLCNYFQEVAGNHAHRLHLANDQLVDDQLAWVLSRLHVRIYRRPSWREHVRCETWPSSVDRLYAYRDFLCRDEDGHTLAEGVSAWLLIDPDTRRPARMPARVTGLHLPDRPRSLGGDPGRPGTLDEPDLMRSFRIRREDLDMMHHVNNVRYVGWCLETVPASLRETHEPFELAVAFRAETVFGESVRVDTAVHSDGEDVRCVHRLATADTGKIVVRAEISWRTR